MNWYKKAQKIPTMENIIWAIDKLIAENYDFTVEDLSQASQGQSEQQYALPKAAQVKTKRKYRKGVGPKLENISPTQTSKVFQLFERGMSNQEITKQVDLTVEEVRFLLRSRFPSWEDQDKYLKDKYEKDILNTTEEKTQEMREDFNIKRIGAKEIASVLKLNTKFVVRILTKNNINLWDFVKERRDRISQLICQIAEDLNYEFTNKQLAQEFGQRHGYKLTLTTLDRTVKLYNLKKRNDFDNINQSFRTYIDSMMQGGRMTLIRRDQEEPGTLSRFIDQFFQQYGEKNGFLPPEEQEMLKNKWLAKLQIRDNTMRMERNKYTPIDYSENNPATFIHDRGQNELV